MLVGYRVYGGWLTMYAFASLTSGLTDLVGVRYEATTSTAETIVDDVQAIVAAWELPLPTVGLGVMYMRATLPVGAMFDEARREFQSVFGKVEAAQHGSR